MAQYRIEDDGIAGLTLALRLRLRGHGVSLADASERVLDEEFTLPAPYRDLFLRSGSPLYDAVPFTEAPGRRVTIDGVHLQLPAAGAHAPVIGAALGAGAGAQWAAFIEDAADIWSSLRKGTYTSSRTLEALATRHLQDARLRRLLEAHLTPYGLDAGHVGDAAAVLPYLEQTFGRWRFAGGMEALEGQLRSRCEAMGVDYADDGEPIALDGFWAGAFRAPAGRWRRRPTVEVNTQALGLPWIGMAAEYIAAALPRPS